MDAEFLLPLSLDEAVGLILGIADLLAKSKLFALIELDLKPVRLDVG